MSSQRLALLPSVNCFKSAAQKGLQAACQTMHDGFMQSQANATGSLHVCTADNRVARLQLWIFACSVCFASVTVCSDSNDQQSHYQSCHYITVLLMVGLFLP